MAISKKEAGRVAAHIRTYVGKDAQGFLDNLFAAVKNKPFRKSLKKVAKLLERPKNGRIKKAA